MAKTKSLTKTAEDMFIPDSDSPNDFANIMQEYGITKGDITAPKPPTTNKENFDQLCDQTYQVVDERGNVIKATGHTGPLMFLEDKGEADGDKFAGYDGFYIFVVAHPKRGKTVLTVGRPKGEQTPEVVRWLKSLTKGQLFQVASVQTSQGNRVRIPIPVQAAP